MVIRLKKNIKSNYTEPVVGLIYQHLTEEELRWLYRNEKNINHKLAKYKMFKRKYDNLEKFEKILNIQTIKENSGNDDFPIWYIIRLIQYKRISVDLEILMKLRLSRKNILNVNSHLIDLDFVNRFEDYAINKLKYKKDRIKRTITYDLIRALLYYNAKIDNFINKSVEYYKVIDDKVKKGIIDQNRRASIRNIINILRQMGYNIKIDFKHDTNLKMADDLLTNVHAEFRNALINYGEYLKNGKGLSINTINIELSHIRSFLNFLYEYYPEVNKFSMLDNEHVRQFIKEQKTKPNMFNRQNSNATINHRLQALKKMLNYLNSMDKFNIKQNVVTEYDMLREPKVYTKYRSEQEILETINAIANSKVEDKLQMQCKLALIIMVDTRRRVSEVLNLRYDCYENGRVFFHKTKHNKPSWQVVGQATIDAIMKLKEYAKYIKTEIYSPDDNQKNRRLFPSAHDKGISVLSRDSVDRFFTKIQIDNKIVDKNGEAKFTLHDNKRNFIACMLNAGVSAESIAKFLNQETNSLIPYEVNNDKAIRTLKSVEEKGLLIGKNHYKSFEEKNNEILKLIKDVNVINRNKQNLIFRLNNPREIMPLAFGYCTDYTNFEICGDLICLACDEFQSDSLEDFAKYSLKMYKYIYQFKRDKIVKKIESKLLLSLEKVYNNIKAVNKEDFKTILRKIKKKAREEVKSNEERS